MVGAGSAGVGSAGASTSGAGGSSSAAGKGGASGKAGSSGAATFPTPCDNAVERVEGSGIMECDNGLVHRPTAGTCPAYVASTTVRKPSTLPDRDECLSDGDCTDRLYGFCAPGMVPYGGTPTPNTCVYGCTVDTECDAGGICVCGEERGDCHPATCTTDGDCDDGSYCAEYSQSCGQTSGFSCQAPGDACQLNSDCGSGFACATRRDDGTRYCTFSYCAG